MFVKNNIENLVKVHLLYENFIIEFTTQVTFFKLKST